MSRRPALFLAIGLAVFTVAVSTVVRVPDAAVGVRSWRGGGTPTLLQPGLAVRIPWLHRVDRYPGGVLALEGTIELASREGVALHLPYRLQARLDPQGLLDLAREGGDGGASAAGRAALEGQLRRSAAAISLYDLASGSAFGPLSPQVARSLEDRLGRNVMLQLGPAGLSPEVRATFEKAAIYGKRRPSDRHILLVGLDGADWDVIDPMIARGELPHLNRLIRSGVRARLRTNIPTLSPLLWTTVATGKAPDRHGINDFLVHDPRTGRRVPINSTFRKVKAFWNILTEAEIPCDVVAWWATWPAESITGHLVSDRVAYSTFDLADPDVRQGAVSPVDYADRVAALRTTDESVTFTQVSRFLKIGEAEFRAARRAVPETGSANERTTSIKLFARILAATRSYSLIAQDLLDRAGPDPGGPRLFAVYFQGLDEVQHRFAHCAPPRHSLCSTGDYDRFRGTVAEFYRYQDEVLGDLLARTRGWTVLLLSDHGFASGAGRPQDEKPFIEGKPGLWHDLTGVFVAAGPGIRRIGEIPTVTLYDVAPTILYLLGLPVAEDMTGKVLETALDPGVLATLPPVRVPSYEGLGQESDPAATMTGRGGPAPAIEDTAAEEIVEQLRSLGYVGGASPVAPPVPLGGGQPGAAGAPVGVTGTPARAAGSPPGAGGEVPTLLYHTNLGAVHLGKRQYELAESEFRKALTIDPSSIQALAGLAILYEAKGDYEKSLQTLRSALRSPDADAQAILVKMAELYIRLGRPVDGLNSIRELDTAPSGRAHRPPGVAIAMGLLEQAAGKPQEAETFFRSALQTDPGSVMAMQELFALYDAQGRAADLEPLLRRALADDPRSAMHHNWLGLVLRRRGDLKGAEAEFRLSLESMPDLTGAMANLGSIYLQQGRKEEAVATLRQALEKDPRSFESRINLIVALGLAGDPDAARLLVEEADQAGLRAPQIYNALAYGLYLNGRNDEAMETLRRSLQMNPDQAEARRLQTAIEQGIAPGAF